MVDGLDDLRTMWTGRDHTTWSNALLEKHLNKRLDNSYKTCNEIVNDTEKRLGEIE